MPEYFEDSVNLFVAMAPAIVPPWDKNVWDWIKSRFCANRYHCDYGWNRFVQTWGFFTFESKRKFFIDFGESCKEDMEWCKNFVQKFPGIFGNVNENRLV